VDEVAHQLNAFRVVDFRFLPLETIVSHEFASAFVRVSSWLLSGAVGGSFLLFLATCLMWRLISFLQWDEDLGVRKFAHHGEHGVSQGNRQGAHCVFELGPGGRSVFFLDQVGNVWAWTGIFRRFDAVECAVSLGKWKIRSVSCRGRRVNISG
jgi:hypothetical protein